MSFESSDFELPDLPNLPSISELLSDNSNEIAGEPTTPSGIELDEAARQLVVPVVTQEETDMQVSTRGKKMLRVDIPKGISPYTFRKVVGAAFSAYLVSGTPPSIDSVKKFAPDLAESRISAVLASPAFKRTMAIRGVALGESTGLLPEQDLLLQILLDPNGVPLSKKLKQAGVTMTKYRAWLKQPLFRQQMQTLGLGILEEHAHDINVAVLGKALEGDISAARFAHEITGRYRPASRDTGPDPRVIIQHFVEVVQRHVKDPATIARIAADLGMIANADAMASGRASYLAAPQNIPEIEG